MGSTTRECCEESGKCQRILLCLESGQLATLTSSLGVVNFAAICTVQRVYTHTHTHPFNGPFSRTTRVSQYQKGKTNLDFTEARDSEWQSHQLGHMQVCTLIQTDNHASTSPFSFLQAGCPSCRPTNSIKALKATVQRVYLLIYYLY